MAYQVSRPDFENNQYRLIRIHPVWHTFIKYCESMKVGEIDKLKIEDGLPILAEEVKKKVKFSE